MFRGRVATVLASDTPDYRLRNTQDVSNLLADTINLVLRGQLDLKIANSVGYLTSVILRSSEQGHTEEEERVARVAVTGSTFRARFKSMWLIAKENEMIQSFEAEAATARECLPNGPDGKS